MARYQPNTDRGIKSEYPNILLATTYALNKSSTKKVTVGLEFSEGSYRQIVKLVTSGAPYKSVTLDEDSWDKLKVQFPLMTSYLQNAYAFRREYGRPNRVFMPKHDLTFTEAYGNRSVYIDERPANSVHCDEGENADVGVASLAEDENPPCKQKKKTSYNIPGICIQTATFEGLRNHAMLIDIHLEDSKELATKVNRTLEQVIEFYKDKFEKEEAERKQSLIADFNAFKQYYALFQLELIDFVFEKCENDSDYLYRDNYMERALKEILAFDLPYLYQRFRDIVSNA